MKETRYRHNGIRLHPVIDNILAGGASEFRTRYSGSRITDLVFYNSAIPEFEKRKLIFKLEARVYRPPFIRADLMELARGQHGSPIWLPSEDLEEAWLTIWDEVFPSFLNGNIIWPPCDPDSPFKMNWLPARR